MSDYGDDDGQNAYADDYDGGFGDEEPLEPEIEDDVDANGDDLDGATADPDARRPAGDNNVVVSGDATAAQKAKTNAVAALKEKKIANDKRMTTPYMTKYERARVLGTRALQIRYVRRRCAKKRE